MTILQGVGFLQNIDGDGFGPENYIVYSGLDPDTSQVLGEYQAQVVARIFSIASPPVWRLTVRVSGQVAWVHESDVTFNGETFAVPLTDYDPSCGGNP